MPDGNQIIAQAADGTQHIFPAGTDVSVIDGAMKRYASSQQTGAMQTRKGAPITNARSLVTDDSGPTFVGNLKEAGLGAISELSGAPETMHPISDMWTNMKEQAKQSAKDPWYKQVMDSMPIVGVGKNLISAGNETLSATSADPQHPFSFGPVDSTKFSHGLGRLLGQAAGLGLLRKTPEAVADPLGKKGFQRVAQEVLNEGPSKARVLADQHAHAIELQKHVAGVADAVHQDAQQAMSQVSEAVDSAKPEGAFDKAELRDRLKTAMGDTLQDDSQLPTSLKKLTTTPKPTFASFLNKNTQDFIGRLKKGGLANDEIAQAMKEQGFQPGEIKAALEDAGAAQPGRMSFEEVKQARSDLGRQLGRLQGPAKAAASAAYGELSNVLREGARDTTISGKNLEPDWIDANAKWKGYLDDFHRSPVAKTLAGENASDIMEPLTGKSRVQTLDILSKYEPFGIDMDKIGQEVARTGSIDTIQRLSKPTKMDLIIAKMSPTGAALRSGVPRMLRNPTAADFLGGKGFETANIKPSKVYPSKEAAAAALKGKGPTKGNPTPFGSEADNLMKKEMLKKTIEDDTRALENKSLSDSERSRIQRHLSDFQDMLGETD